MWVKHWNFERERRALHVWGGRARIWEWSFAFDKPNQLPVPWRTTRKSVSTRRHEDTQGWGGIDHANSFVTWCLCVEFLARFCGRRRRCSSRDRPWLRGGRETGVPEGAHTGSAHWGSRPARRLNIRTTHQLANARPSFTLTAKPYPPFKLPRNRKRKLCL